MSAACIYLRLFEYLSCSGNILLFFLCVCILENSHVCNVCAHVTHMGMFPRDKTAVLGTSAAFAPGKQLLEESLVLCRTPLCSHGQQHNTLNVHTRYKEHVVDDFILLILLILL